jgi:hypothetical protein
MANEICCFFYWGILPDQGVSCFHNMYPNCFCPQSRKQKLPRRSFPWGDVLFQLLPGNKVLSGSCEIFYAGHYFKKKEEQIILLMNIGVEVKIAHGQ